MPTPLQEALSKEQQSSPNNGGAISNTNNTTAPKPTGSTPLQKALIIEKYDPKLSHAMTDAAVAKKASDQANSFSGFMGNFAKALIPNLWDTVKDVVTMPVKMIAGEFNPNDQTKAEEKQILPEPKNTYEKIAYALPNALYKIPFRFFQPMFQPYADTLSQSIVSKEFDPMVASGKMSVKDFQDAFPALQKTDLQAIGESVQTGLAIYAPTFFGKQAGDLISQPLKKALYDGFSKSLPIGMAFGTAQALASGSKDPAEILKMVSTQTIGMGLIGAIISGAIPLKNSFAKKTMDVIKQDHGLPPDAEKYIYDNKKTIDFKPPETKTQSDSSALPNYKPKPEDGLTKENITALKKQGFDEETIAKMNESAKAQKPKAPDITKSPAEVPPEPPTGGETTPTEASKLTETPTTEPVKPAETTPEQTAKVEADTKVLEDTFNEDTFKDDPTFDKTTFKKQAQTYNDMLAKDRQEVFDIAMGNKTSPDLNATVAYKLFSEDPNLTGEEALRISRAKNNPKSPGYVLSKAGQELSLSRIGKGGENPVKTMEDIAKGKEAELVKATGEKDVVKAKTKLLNKFLDDITCK